MLDSLQNGEKEDQGTSKNRTLSGGRQDKRPLSRDLPSKNVQKSLNLKQSISQNSHTARDAHKTLHDNSDSYD